MVVEAGNQGAKKACWSPQLGPQSDAIAATWCRQLFYGGARGAGKSDFMLGDYLQDVPRYGRHWQGIIFRRTYKQLSGLILRSHEIYSQSGARWLEGKGQWEWPNGACLRFRHLERDADAEQYQGHQYCVAVGTRILMADGSPKNIEHIKRGELVQTLNGPKRVTACIAPYLAPCVRASTPFGEQIHPIWHRILTSAGWEAFSSYRETDSKESERKFRESDKHHRVSFRSRLFASQIPADRLSPTTSGFCSADKCYESSWLSNLVFSLRRLSKYFDPLRSLEVFRPLPRYALATTPVDAFGRGQRDFQTAQDFLSDCQSYLRSYGERLLCRIGIDLNEFPFQGDAAKPRRERCKRDEAGSTQIDNRLARASFCHPYSGQELSASEASVFGACEMSYFGDWEVADIEVEDANHYISYDTKLINRNCFIGFEELGNWPDSFSYDKITACNRWGEADIPTKRIRSTGNPGGVGQGWIKTKFIDHAPLGFEPRICEKTGHDIMFVPGNVWDNKILLENDPDYINTLKGVGSPELVRAWLYGDWNAIVGGYFPEFGARHIIQPFEIPDHWTRIRGIDWGSSKPFVVQWAAVSDGTLPQFPPNALIVYREWYGGSEPNVGLKLSSRQVAEGIHDREAKDEKITDTVIDPAAFKSDDGPSTGERLNDYGIACRPADNKRIVGWQQLRDRLIGYDNRPMLYVVGASCSNLVRTLPALQHDERKPEDVDTEGDDHCGDTLRYLCMSRPYTPPKFTQPAIPQIYQEATYNDLFDLGASSSKYSDRI